MSIFERVFTIESKKTTLEIVNAKTKLPLSTKSNN